MPALHIESQNQKQCKLDELSLGEVMLRLDPGSARERPARSVRHGVPMAMPGDTSMARWDEVLGIMRQNGARISR